MVTAATYQVYTLSLHDALPICPRLEVARLSPEGVVRRACERGDPPAGTGRPRAWPRVTARGGVAAGRGLERPNYAVEGDRVVRGPASCGTRRQRDTGQEWPRRL